MKNTILKKIGTLLLVLILLVSASACGGSSKSHSGFGGYVDVDLEDEYTEEDSETLPDEESVPGEGEELPEDEPAEEDEKEEITGEFINPLTGIACSESVYNTRPVAIMVNNIKASLPQIGVSEADVMYEVLVEGGITRLICVYKDYKKVDEIGSIRSVRDYCIDISDVHDAILVHSGQSPVAQQVIYQRGTQNINGEFMYRSKERLATMSSEHTHMITGKRLAEGISKKGYRETTKAEQPFIFYKSEIAPKGQNVSYIEFCSSPGSVDRCVTHFNFDAESGVYKKGQFGEEHIDGDDGKVLTFKNVVLLECAHGRLDNEGRITINFVGKGKGKIFTMGKYADIVWKKDSRTSSYKLYEVDGETPLKLNAGKTYIGIIPTGTAVTMN